MYLLLNFISYLLYLYGLAFLIYCIMTWIPGATRSAAFGWLSRIIDPALGAIQRAFPRLDPMWSGLILWLVLWLLGRII
ncbi:YggT family protein [Lacticaseibacillus pantheris]|uniref:YggT family protein n=1 Tax=Lacticaseibacillus pantheris DSM 15945 = JCM 12539 = NBRC 106106 TaxID=1423783 RepID=A0A0R1U709_9LACO|nr:YggT family protein [Lacticaseibacillus pantheris]KRL86869.1 hypothetical protein FC50_GL000517 [Lacticaseibacillus pantheris DSM 15945 = JCM 12539 = NBRC 106106]WKF84549.1 YggT family protein [Lacticaseibacillus pantheris]